MNQQAIDRGNQDSKLLQIREKFAAMALQGLLANPGAGGYPSANDIEWTASLAVKFADGLLEALEVPRQ